MMDFKFKWKLKNYFVAALLIFALRSVAQLPDTDIYVLDISYSGDSMVFTNPVNITHRVGYDNQPFFIDDNSLFYTSVRDTQSDIYQYDLDTKTEKQITHTPESEYSPQMMPLKRDVSVVRVEADNKTQRIWGFPLNGSEPLPVWKTNKLVGYYCWLDDIRLAAFVLPDSTKGDTVAHLEIYKTSTRQTTQINGHFGRTLALMPVDSREKTLTFVNKFGTLWWIEKLNLDSKVMVMEEIVATLPGQEDFCWTPSGILLMGKDGILYSYNPKTDEYDWKPIADFRGTEYERFYRIAVSPSGNKLAIVTFVGEKP